MLIKLNSCIFIGILIRTEIMKIVWRFLKKTESTTWLDSFPTVHIAKEDSHIKEYSHPMMTEALLPRANAEPNDLSIGRLWDTKKVLCRQPFSTL